MGQIHPLQVQEEIRQREENGARGYMMSEKEMEESTTNELKNYLRKFQGRVTSANYRVRKSDGEKKKELQKRLESNKAHLETVQEKIRQREENAGHGYMMSEEDMEKSTTEELKKYLHILHKRVASANYDLRKSVEEKKKKLEQRLELKKSHVETVQEKIRQREENGARGYMMSEEDMEKRPTKELRDYLRKCQGRVDSANSRVRKSVGEKKKKLQQRYVFYKAHLETVQ